ncbi:MAG: clostripain-related cysteine peptidase [Elusimicrobiales bacterium]|nr:clostripain-related cysteine peptidase [Elusimicrobiales bacterium]
MIKKNLNLLSAALSFIVLGSSALRAQDFDLNGISAADIKAAQADKGILDIFSPAKPEAPMPVKEWTVMVFMNAKNNLSESQLLGLSGKWAVKDMAEMKKVGTTDKINIVVEHGATGKGSRRLLIEKGGFLSSGEKVYGEFPDADMGDYKRVVEFVQWSKKTFPAKKYMLVLWNHGLGWIDPNMQQAPSGTGTANKGILFDDETKNYVRTRQLGEMMKGAGYVDVLMQNACLQQMAEVLYEMKDYAGLFVGSEETMLAQGFDYEKLLAFMNANTAFTDEQFSDWLMNWYKEFYAAGMSVGPLTMPLDTVTGTLSTVRPAALNDLPGYLDAFAGAAMRNNETEAAKAAIGNVIRFTSLDPKNDKKKLIAAYADLYDFAALFDANARSQETRLAARNLMGFIKNTLVMRSVGLHKDAENGYNYENVGGLAINTTMKIKTVPPQLAAIFETKYGDLSLSKASQWDEFVTWSDGVWRK